MQHQGITCQARWRGHAVAQVIQYVACLAARQHIGPGEGLLRAEHDEATITTRGDAVRRQAVTAVAWPRQVVPKYLQAIAWQRKRQYPGKTLHAVAVIDQMGAGGVVPGPLAHPSGHRDTAVRRVDRQAKRAGVTLEQRHLACRELLAIARVVLRSDGV
ncbi:hypothetical protein D3C80_1678790 [compost metagenome]